MKELYYKLLKYFSRLQGKIAFYPTLISIWGLIFAFIMYYAENQGISSYLVDNFPLFVIDDIATARLILATFIGGLVSIMVFSFSMVMILLNNASSNFSPRVLPGIISNRRHQFILGVYNASLLYFIFTLVNIEPTGDKYQLPGFSVILAIMGMIICLGMFIYFIHSISQEIQVDNIMERIYLNVEERLEELVEKEDTTSIKYNDFKDSSHWDEIRSGKSGYLRDLNIKPFLKLAKENDVKIYIVPMKGNFIYEGDLLLKTSKKLDEDDCESICSQFIFNNDELVEDNYVLGFKQITEIAVKAMSPGINDPGTCINAIDYLTGLFLLRIKKMDTSYYFKDSEPIVEFNIVSFDQILYSVMASLRTYVSHDILIVNKLLGMLEKLLRAKDFAKPEYQMSIISEVTNLHQDVLESLTNERDIALFEEKMSKLKDHITL
ncbi:Uncharacterized membrane protein [Flavobacteriaceae bacterium MAR_2010_188]|nr:Uncharacterized membrane protein [Flavobacteriaceae bacterium MAR_2010_188]